jgi:hypothetical protein
LNWIFVRGSRTSTLRAQNHNHLTLVYPPNYFKCGWAGVASLKRLLRLRENKRPGADDYQALIKLARKEGAGP